MYLLYVDGSGTPESVPLTGAVPPDQNTYAVVGVCVHEGTWYAFEKRLKALKDRYGLAGHKPELHALAFCCSFNEQDKVPKFEELDWVARRQAVEHVQQLNLIKLPSEDRKEKRKKYIRSSKGAIAGSHEERNFKRIFHIFDRGGGRLHGLRHYCLQNSCQCIICVERGH